MKKISFSSFNELKLLLDQNFNKILLICGENSFKKSERDEYLKKTSEYLTLRYIYMIFPHTSRYNTRLSHSLFLSLVNSLSRQDRERFSESLRYSLDGLGII